MNNKKLKLSSAQGCPVTLIHGKHAPRDGQIHDLWSSWLALYEEGYLPFYVLTCPELW